MNPSQLFLACNLVAVIGWLLLIFAGRLRFSAQIICKFVIPVLLSTAYVAILATHWAGHQGGFNSLDQVQLLFQDPWLVLMSWVHYLAFDLFLGAWQVREAIRSGFPYWWTIPSLILTFLFGPLGFLVFLIIRALGTRWPLTPSTRMA